MSARCGVSACVLWLQLLRCKLRWPALQSTSAGGRLSQFARESALHHALHARPIVALRARLLKRAPISALVRPFQAQATTVSAVCQAGFAPFRRCGLTIRSSGLPMSVCAKISRRRRQPLNSSVRLRRVGRASVGVVIFLHTLSHAAAARLEKSVLQRASLRE